MLRATIASLAALALCGCGDAGDGQQRNVTRITMANPVSDQLKGGDDLYRAIGLRRAIIDSGQRCKKVDGAAYQQEYKNQAMWTAHCSDSGDWAVFISPGGEAQARTCADLVQLKIVTCKPTPRFEDPEKKG